MEVSLRNVVRRGLGHSLNCEDEVLSTIFDNNLAVMVVFDGCSTGVKSSFASGLLCKIFRKVFIQNKYYFDESIPEISLENISRYIIRQVFRELQFVTNYLEMSTIEVLSTIVMAVVDINSKTAHTIIIGDGSIYVDEKMFSINSPGNEPNYLAYFLNEKEFLDVWQKAVVYSETHCFEKNLSVMTDGIDSFFNISQNRYLNEDEKSKVIDVLLKGDRFLKNKIGLARLCNILQIVERYEPKDDLAISRLTILNQEENDFLQ